MVPPIKGFLKSTLIDWEGKIASEVFLPGCNFRCRYCHSPHLVFGSDDSESIPLDIIVEAIAREEGWTDGVVVSGGEPTIHAGLVELIHVFRQIDLSIKLDTNGTNPRVLKGLIDADLVNFVSMDVKAPLTKQRYEAIVGVPCDIAPIKESIAILLEGKIDYEFRTTVCPAYLEAADIETIASQIAPAKRYVLQNFRPLLCLDKELESVRPYTIDDLKEMANLASRHVAECRVRGVYDAVGTAPAACSR